MKKYLLLLAVLFFTTIASAQKIDKYCRVDVYNQNAFSHKLLAKISFGAEKSLFNLKDTTELHELRTVNTLTSETDVLNFMSKAGWALVDLHADVFYFKKTYNSSDLAE